jgi:hypothetical protein
MRMDVPLSDLCLGNICLVQSVACILNCFSTTDMLKLKRELVFRLSSLTNFLITHQFVQPVQSVACIFQINPPTYIIFLKQHSHSPR